MVEAVTQHWMIYGANGYTGQLVARLAVRRGERPILAGRTAAPIRQFAAELGLPYRVVPLTDPRALREALSDVDVVANCAGPFEATAEPMADACLASATHYVDVAGEVTAFEQIYARHTAARAAGVVLLPGAGFDVVPTDCLAATLFDALPRATRLELAFLAGGGVSPGTFKVTLRILAQGNLRRVAGRLTAAPYGLPRRVVPFPSGPRELGAFRTADLASAYRSTGIPDITVYVLPARRRSRVGAVGLAAAQTALRLNGARWLVERAVGWRMVGPSPHRRAHSRCEIWGEVRDRTGSARSLTLVGPNPYEMTADTLLRSVRHLLAGTGPAGPVAPGAHTPSSAFGTRFVRELDGVEVGELRETRPSER